MTTLVLTSPAEVTAAVGSVVTVTVTVSDDTVPVFRSSDGYKLSAKKNVGTGAWSAQWVTLKAGTYAITVNAGDATPVSASVVVGGGGGGPDPDPEVTLSDEAVAVLLTLTDSATRAAARTLVAADVANPASAIGGALLATIATGVEAAVEDPAGAAAKRFSRGDQAFNVTTSSLRHWRTALAGAEAMGNNSQESARALFGWNSIPFGFGLNAVTPNAPAQVSAMFERDFPAAGTGIVHMVSPSSFQQDGANAVDNRVNRVGTWEAAARGAFGAGCLRATGNTKQLKFTETGVEFVIYYAKAADGGTMTVQVDGGATANIDCSGTGLGSYTLVNTIATGSGGTALTDVSHVVTITAPASGYGYVTGVEARRSKTGVRVTRAALSGSHTGQLLTNDESMAAVFDQAAPHLSILLELINDWLNIDLPIATFKSRWATIIARAKLTGDVLIVVPPISNEAGTFPFEDYVDALYELADEHDCALVDIHARWGTYAEAAAAGLMGGDAYHPSFKGYRDLARAVYEVIGTKAPGSTVAAGAVLSKAQTFTARQTFNAGLTIATGQTLIIGDVTIQRTAAFTLDLGTIAKAAVLGGGTSVNNTLGAVNGRGSTGRRAISAQGSDGVERGGFNIDGRLFVLSTDMLGTAPGAATKGVPIYDQNGTLGYVAWTPA